jgi:hypothetical protein
MSQDNIDIKIGMETVTMLRKPAKPPGFIFRIDAARGTVKVLLRTADGQEIDLMPFISHGTLHEDIDESSLSIHACVVELDVQGKDIPVDFKPKPIAPVSVAETAERIAAHWKRQEQEIALALAREQFDVEDPTLPWPSQPPPAPPIAETHKLPETPASYWKTR